ncbi:plastid transcriptionally active 16 [Wolffia australiana]
MAPALSSSFLPAQPHAKLRFRPPPSRAAVAPPAAAAKQPGGNGAPPTFPSFRIGKNREDDSAANDPQQQKKPFFLDIGLLPAAANGGAAPSPAALVFGGRRRKDPLSVFVAGATGQAGARIARSLLRRGFSVRAGVPDLAAAQELAKIAVQYKIISPDESRRLNAVESGFDDAESIARTIGNATKVVVTVGPAEDGPAAAVTTDDALRVVQAAQLAGASHVVIVYDGGAAAASSESAAANVLVGISSFFNNLFSSAKPTLSVAQLLEKVATETELGYTLVQASLGDDGAAEPPRGLVVAGEGAGVAGEVSRSQIAALITDVLGNVAVAENKVVEVSASSAAPPRPVEELFGAIAEDGRRKAFKEAKAREIAEEEALIASERAAEAAAMAKKLEAEVKKLSEQEARAAGLADEARRKAEAAGASVESIIAKAKNLGGDFSWDKLGSQFSAAMASKQEGEPKVQVATVRGQAKARALPAQKAVVKTPPKSAPAKPAAAPPRSAAAQPQGKSIFGGLFPQETIYVDDE